MIDEYDSDTVIFLDFGYKKINILCFVYSKNWINDKEQFMKAEIWINKS